MVILVFRGSKGEDPEVFLREYKRACIGTGLRTIAEWLNFLPEFLEEELKGSWNDITKALVKEFSVKNQGALELVRECKDRTMTLQHKLQGCFRAQGHEGTDPLFAGVNAVVLEHFTIGMLSELRQQVRYERATTFDGAREVAEKKEASMEEVPRPTAQTMVKTVQLSTEPEVRKHPKVSSRMESDMEQMINQMNQLSLHLLQPRTNKNRNVERDLEGREKVLMGLEKSLLFPEDAMDVMAQAKRPMEDTTHPDVSIKRFKEMARASKKNRRRRFDFQDFPISRDYGPYSVVKDLVAMVPSAYRELRKGLTPKVPKVPTPLNAIAAERECDLIIDVQCNGLVLRGVLVDGGAGVNVMTIPAMRYLGLKIDRPASVTLKMANKRIVKPEGVISNVVITVMRVSTIVDFHVVLEEDGAYLMILGRPWLTKSHARNY
ncbi:hypothetical protein BDL97_17G098800 [Sphagnum fallax]|nr:hypothetical protein BDL97_17G098800 [Sphagnum fallax]